MKKIIVVGLLLIVSIFAFINKYELIYQYHTFSFDEISTDEFYELLTQDKEETYFVYFGRSTCPYCRDFVDDLKEAAKKTNTDIYYVDTENTETEPSLKALREQLGVKLVPSLVKINTLNDTIVLLDITNRKTEDLMLHFN